MVGDVAGLADGTGSLSVFTNEKGGIIDDTVVTKVSDTEIYLVVNAGCREKDLAHLGKHLAAYKVRRAGAGLGGWVGGGERVVGTAGGSRAGLFLEGRQQARDC